MSVILRFPLDVVARALRRPLRVAVGWQLGLTIALIAVFAVVAGVHGAVSAALGGAICTAPFVLAGWLATRRLADSTVSMLTSALWAEMIRVVLIVLLLAATLYFYRDLNAAAFFASFIASIVVLSLAVFVRDIAATDNSAVATTPHGRV